MRERGMEAYRIPPEENEPKSAPESGEKVRKTDKQILKDAHDHATSLFGEEPVDLPWSDERRLLYWENFHSAYDRYVDDQLAERAYHFGADDEDVDDFGEETEPTAEVDEAFRTKMAELLKDFAESLSKQPFTGNDAMNKIEELESIALDANGARPRYEFFPSREARQELFEYTRRITDYMRHYDVANLVIPDRSARPLAVSIREYWKTQHPDEALPGMYFVNPKGFYSRERSQDDDIEHAVGDAFWKGDAPVATHQVRPEAEVKAEFAETYRNLMNDKEKPVLVFDTCIHSGRTLGHCVDTMKELGFTQLIVGSVNPSDKGARVQTDMYLTDIVPDKGCYPFDKDRTVEKTFESVSSSRSARPAARLAGIRLRKEIRNIIREQLADEDVAAAAE
jgi:hypothetical protein